MLSQFCFNYVSCFQNVSKITDSFMAFVQYTLTESRLVTYGNFSRAQTFLHAKFIGCFKRDEHVSRGSYLRNVPTMYHVRTYVHVIHTQCYINEINYHILRDYSAFLFPYLYQTFFRILWKTRPLLHLKPF